MLNDSIFDASISNPNKVAPPEMALLMLLSLVGLAAIIIPFHHKLEHWAVNKLVENNKRARLEAAKRTIEQLEV